MISEIFMDYEIPSNGGLAHQYDFDKIRNDKDKLSEKVCQQLNIDTIDDLMDYTFIVKNTSYDIHHGSAPITSISFKQRTLGIINVTSRERFLLGMLLGCSDLMYG